MLYCWGCQPASLILYYTILYYFTYIFFHLLPFSLASHQKPFTRLPTLLTIFSSLTFCQFNLYYIMYFFFIITPIYSFSSLAISFLLLLSPLCQVSVSLTIQYFAILLFILYSFYIVYHVLPSQPPYQTFYTISLISFSTTHSSFSLNCFPFHTLQLHSATFPS